MTTQRQAAPTQGRLAWLGANVDYEEAWELQRRIAGLRAAGDAPDTLLLLEHAPVYTAGRRSPPEHIVGDLGFPLVETDRGGLVTYHGPGQLVGYPIVDLTALGVGPRAYVRAIETAVVRALASYGLAAHVEEGLTGVWTNHGKIAAIGVRIARGVSMHGFALNVRTDLAAYEPIVPCGIPDRPVTSVARELGSAPSVEEMGRAVAERLGEQLGVMWREDRATVLTNFAVGSRSVEQ